MMVKSSLSRPVVVDASVFGRSNKKPHVRIRVVFVWILLACWGLSLIVVFQIKISTHAHHYDGSLFLPSSPASPSLSSSSSSSMLQDKPRVLDPFRDIRLQKQQTSTTTTTTRQGDKSSSTNSPHDNDKNLAYSSFHCVQADQSGNPDYQARTCEFTNLYYRPSNQTFLYYASPSEIAFHANATQDGTVSLYEAMTVADGFLRWDKLITGLETHSTEGEEFSYEWKPQIVTTMMSSKSVATIQSPSQPVWVLYLPSYSFNFGHLVFDDLLSIYAMLEIFGFTQTDNNDDDRPPPTVIPLFVERPAKSLGLNFGSRDPFWRCHPTNPKRWSMCRKLWSRIYPGLLAVQPDPDTGDILRTGNLFRGTDSIGLYDDMAKAGKVNLQKGDYNTLPPHTDLVVLSKVLAGPGRLANWSCKGECAIGRGAWLWGFRQYLYQNLFGWHRGRALAQHKPPKLRDRGYITFSLPVGTTHPDKVTMFQDVIPVAEQTYGKERVRVVDMAKLSLTEQADLVRNSLVYLTNHGGGSASGLFVPRGATIVIFHGVGRLGEDKMLDRHFWNSLGYARVLWIHPTQHHNVDRTMAMIDYAIQSNS